MDDIKFTSWSLLTIYNNTYLIVIHFVNTDKVTSYEETSDTAMQNCPKDAIET